MQQQGGRGAPQIALTTLPIEAPESTKIDVQLKEILTDYITRAPGKDFNSKKLLGNFLLK